jgi:Cft2 family RNA processing exonuclease
VKLTDLNRHGGIGANSLLLEIGGFRLLVDAGIHPKRDGLEATPSLEHLRGLELDAVILTHCHLDHLGALPLVLRSQHRPPVLASLPSATLAPRMLHNSVNVMLRGRQERGIREYPLFTHDEADLVKARLFPMAFNQPRRLHAAKGEQLEITFFPAGHVAGAAGVRLVHKHRRILLTGDVLFAAQATIPGARFPEETVDTLVLETTRGATQRTADRDAELLRLMTTIQRTIDGGGSVLLPVFALGRMQELLVQLHRARQRGVLGSFPVFAAGLGLDLADYFDDIARRTGLVQFSKGVIKSLRVQPAPRDIVPGRPPAVRGLYILSSGMVVENTPSYKMAAALASRHENAILFVGYCDPETPGGRLLTTPRESRFLFDALPYEAPLRCAVDRFDISGHADRDELVDFAVKRQPRAVVLTHGDPPARRWFAENLPSQLPAARILDPVPGTTHEV